MRMLQRIGGVVTFLLVNFCATDRVEAFTETEVERGRKLFGKCSACHWTSRDDVGDPKRRALSGDDARVRLEALSGGDTTVVQLVDYIMVRMPANNPGCLTEQESMALAAFILFENGVAADGHPMDRVALEDTMLDRVWPASSSSTPGRYFVGGAILVSVAATAILLRSRLRRSP